MHWVNIFIEKKGTLSWTLGAGVGNTGTMESALTAWPPFL